MASIHRALRLAVIASWLSLPAAALAYEPPAVEFLSPRHHAIMVLPQTNIILRPGGLVTRHTGEAGPLLDVNGSISGSHSGQFRVSDDRRTVTFQPDRPFQFSETVTCRLMPGLATDTQGAVAPGEFSFTIAAPERERLRDLVIPSDRDDDLARAVSEPAPGPADPNPNGASAAPVESLPFDFPAIHADLFGTPARGRLFVSDIFFNIHGPRIPSYLMILENDGTPYFYRQLDGVGLDFKVQPNGRLTYFNSSPDAFYAMNARYAVVDSFRCGNGYSTDNHDLQLLPDGHALLMSYDPQPVDLSAVGGQPNAIVIGLIIQELDRDKNVVFQWRSWDHFQVTDMVSHSIESPLVDYVHGNSIEVDRDGNLILSSRHMNEVTKISRATGEILWRLGGKHNQFRFVNEPLAFAHQHDVRVLPDGHLTMFDNGNFRVPQFSRAVEYAIDETNKTATLVWQYRLTPDVFGVAFGSVQRLPNGNTLIGWGATRPTLTEVTPEGQIVARMSFDSGVATYRAFRFEWPPVLPATISFEPATLALDPAANGDRGRGAVRALIQSQSGVFAPSDVEIATVRLAGTVPADTSSAQPDRDGVSVEFRREAIDPLLVPGTNRLEVSGSLATGEVFRGLAVLEVVGQGGTPERATPRLVSAPGTLPLQLEVDGPEDARRTVAVYDVRGRLMRRWPMGPGTVRVSWDGRDSGGRPVASGLYWVRVEGGPRAPATKIAIVR